MKIIRVLLLIIGLIFVMMARFGPGVYLAIVALYSPLWGNEQVSYLFNEKRPEFWKRILARVFDFMILSIPIRIIFIQLGPRITILFLFIYFFISLAIFRKTIGDKIVGLEIRSFSENEEILWSQIALRVFFAPIGFFQGLVHLSSNKKLLIHDRISKIDMFEK